MIGQKTFGSGDLNLAAALTTMGVPPDSRKPIELIARDNGRDYTRFHFLPLSLCGKYSPEALSAAWGDPVTFKAANPAHPFSVLMDFISARPQGCTNKDEWLQHAAKFLGLSMDAVRKTYSGIEQTCKASPESPASYVLAFIRNRIDLITTAKKLAAAGDFSNMQDRGKSVSIIPAKAPKRIRDFLISHIR